MKSASLFMLGILCCLLAVAGTFFLLRGQREVVSIGTTNFDGGLRGHSLVINGVHSGLNLEKPADLGAWGDPGKDFSRLATTYYHRRGPLGIVLEKFNWFPGTANTYRADARLPTSLVGSCGADLGTACLPLASLVSMWSEPPIGVIDLNDGTQASYARPLQIMDFFESNQAVVDLSFPGNDKVPVFHFVQDALHRGAAVRAFVGPQEKTLREKGPEKFYRVLVVETSRGDARVLADRITPVAMQGYFTTVTVDGILCFHTPDRHHDTSRVIAEAALMLGYAHRIGQDFSSESNKNAFHFTSLWVMVARKQEYLNHLREPQDGNQRVPAFWTTLQEINELKNNPNVIRVLR